MTCPTCSSADARTKNHTTRDASVIDCPQCGNYTISRRAIASLGSSEFDRWKISAWISEFKPAIISSTELETARARAVPSLHHRAERMLRWITIKFPPGKEFTISTLQHHKMTPVRHRFSNQPENPHAYLPTGASQLIPIGWNKTIQEMAFMLNDVLCTELGWIVRKQTDASQYQVSPKGLLYLEGCRESVSSVGFCAMWFGDVVLPLWKQVIEPAIRAAGYEPIRIDSKQHNGKIDDEIMASIRSSRFVVSDFTGNRGGVYYEAGFAHGLGLPVIFMCRESDLKDIHFDVRQYNCILWTQDKLEEAQSQLKNRILATLGQGPKLVQ